MRKGLFLGLILATTLAIVSSANSAMAQVTLSLPETVAAPALGKKTHVPIKLEIPGISNLAGFQFQVTVNLNTPNTLKLQLPSLGIAGTSVQKVINCSPINNICFVSGANVVTGLNANVFVKEGNVVNIVFAVDKNYTGGNMSISSLTATDASGEPLRTALGNSTCSIPAN